MRIQNIPEYYDPAWEPNIDPRTARVDAPCEYIKWFWLSTVYTTTSPEALESIGASYIDRTG